MPDLAYLVFLVADGALAGSIYALVALAFVVVYKASRMINFAVGEWTMLGARTTAAASHMFGLSLAGAIGVGCAAMVAAALLFNQVVLRPLRRRSLLSVIAGTLWSFASGGGFGIELLGFKVFPIVILGGLDSLPGTIIGAFVVGILESLVAGYLDPIVGGGFSHVASYLVLIAALFVRPWGLFG